MNNYVQKRAVVIASILGIAIVACSNAGNSKGSDTSKASQPATASDSSGAIVRNLTKFDTLDFAIFSHQMFDRFKESHADDITVTWPDGHDTHGLAKHIEDMKALFVPMPDLAIPEHPIRIANGHWTAVVGRMTGTFTKPMLLGNGKMMQPNGKKLDLSMTTIGHWTDAGVMDHEWLFWDNQTYMKQLGMVP